MNILLLLLLYSLISIGFGASPAGTTKWGYISGHGLALPPDWKTLYPTCGGDRQSPISIQTDKVQYVEGLKPIIVTKLDNFAEDVSLEKHSTSIYLRFANHWKITFGDEKCLKPVSIHWHWGAANCQGSEHLMNGHSYPIEGHLVSYDCEKYQDAKTAISAPNGLFVIGVFYTVGPSNPVLEKILKLSEPIILKNTTNVNISEIPPSELLPKNLKEYYQYDGSLTTPPCTENVRWTILKEMLTISDEQLNRFRELEFELPETGKMINNFRTVIPTNSKRSVISSFKSSMGLGSTMSTSVMVICLLAYLMDRV